MLYEDFSYGFMKFLIEKVKSKMGFSKIKAKIGRHLIVKTFFESIETELGN